MKPDSKEFKALQAKWDKKLKDRGFDDIEQRDGNLKVWSSFFFKKRHNPILFEAKEEYYRAAGKFLYDHKWTSKKDRTIWELHCQGKSARVIVKEMKSRHFRINKPMVHQIINKYVAEMNKQWKLKTPSNK